MLGEQLRSVRKKRGFSLEELARNTGFSKSFLSQIENGKNSPSIASLKKITEVLDVGMGALFEENLNEQVYFNKGTDRRSFEVVKDKVIYDFGASNVPHRKMEAIFFTLLPGAESEGEYNHDGEEFGTVVEGTLLFESGGKQYWMEPGDSIYLRSNVQRKWSNPGDATMRALWVITPPSF